MIGEIILVGGVAAVISFAEQQNAFGNNPARLWWFDPQRYAPVPAARAIRPTPITPISSQQRIAMAQNSMAIAQRQIADANAQQMQETRYVQQSGKYTVSRW
jgi:hypothetical protein